MRTTQLYRYRNLGNVDSSRTTYIWVSSTGLLKFPKQMLFLCKSFKTLSPSLTEKKQTLGLEAVASFLGIYFWGNVLAK